MIYNMTAQGGITPSGTKTINISSNGTVSEDVTAFATAQVITSVPNSYSAADAGKVVSGASLVAQTTSLYTANGSYNTTTISGITISINTAPTLQTKSESYTPAETVITDSITPDAGYDGLNQVDITVNAISSTYVGTGVARKSSADLMASGSVVTAPAGYYSSGASMAVTGGTATTPATTITTNPAITVNAAGLITATNTGTSNITPTVVSGYVSQGTAGTVTVSGTKTSQLTTQAAATITPSTASQLAVASGMYTTGSVYVSPIPSAYIIPTGTSAITANGTGIDIASYASVNVNVPNSYSAADEGKVVSGSTLVGQTSSTVTSNSTYDTTLINSLTVNVSGGGGGNSGPLIVASGTFTGAGGYDLAVPVGKKMPKTDFWVKFIAQSTTNFASDGSYKFAYVECIANSDMGYFTLSSVQDGYQLISDLSFKVNGTSRTAGSYIGHMTTVRNTGASNYGRPNNFRINRKSDHFEVRMYNSNNSYLYPTGVTYNYEVVYFGFNSAADIVEIT